jgi:hypothetical protein
LHRPRFGGAFVLRTSAMVNDLRYINICVEQINYTPVSYDWLVAKARKAMA